MAAVLPGFIHTSLITDIHPPHLRVHTEHLLYARHHSQDSEGHKDGENSVSSPRGSYGLAKESTNLEGGLDQM